MLFFLQPGQFLFNLDLVIENKFLVHAAQIADGIHAALRMGNIFIQKTTHHMDETIHLGKLVQQGAGNLGFGTTLQTGNIRISHLGINGFARFKNGGKLIHPFIRHIHHGGMHFHPASRCSDGLFSAGEGIKNGGFSGLGQSNDSKAHKIPSYKFLVFQL